VRGWPEPGGDRPQRGDGGLPDQPCGGASEAAGVAVAADVERGPHAERGERDGALLERLDGVAIVGAWRRAASGGEGAKRTRRSLTEGMHERWAHRANLLDAVCGSVHFLQVLLEAP
jgi:hypothetical protein